MAIDGSVLPAYANGFRDLPSGKPRDHYSDPDASWGHRSPIPTRKGGGYYGYKIHPAVCTATGLPLAWQVESASENEQSFVPGMLDTVIRRGFTPATCAMDNGYDVNAIYRECEERNVRPIIPLRQTVNVVNGLHKPPRCQHGTWTFAGPDTKRGASNVALPDRPVPARVRLDQGRPAAHPRPTRHRAVGSALPAARRGRARVRQPQAQLVADPAPGASDRASAAARRPDHPRPPRLRAVRRQGRRPDGRIAAKPATPPDRRRHRNAQKPAKGPELEYGPP